MLDFNVLKGALARYLEASPEHPPENINRDFEEVSHNAPPEAMAEGINHAFRSSRTPSFDQMIAQLYRRGTGSQKAGLLNILLGALGPSGLSGAGPALAGLRGLLKKGKVTAGEAAKLSPETVGQLASHADRMNPSVIDEVSQFLTQHAGWLKSLGPTALTVILMRMAGREHP